MRSGDDIGGETANVGGRTVCKDLNGWSVWGGGWVGEVCANVDRCGEVRVVGELCAEVYVVCASVWQMLGGVANLYTLRAPIFSLLDLGYISGIATETSTRIYEQMLYIAIIY